MTLAEAVAQGIARLRLPQWADPQAYIKLDLFPDGRRGPWLHLYERKTQEVCDLPTPQDLLQVADDPSAGWEPYTGPWDPADTGH